MSKLCKSTELVLIKHAATGLHGFFEKFFKVLSGELIKFLLNWFVYR